MTTPTSSDKLELDWQAMTIGWLEERYGNQYQYLELGLKAEVLTTLTHAIRLMDDDSDGETVDPDTAWDTAKTLYGYHLPEGFDFAGIAGEPLEQLIRSQFREISAQIAAPPVETCVQ